MEGIRAEVLPPNRVSFDNYFISVWNYVHTLTAAVTPLVSELGTNLDRFKSYLEAEEARLGTNLKAVDYVIDGTDTLTLLTGVGRIEKVGREHIHSITPRSQHSLCFVDDISSNLLAD
jgi:hypothetical protein